MSIFYPGGMENNFIGLAIMPIGDEDNNVKLNQDTYEVIVNGDKVGNKVLLTQTDDAHDLNSYLKDNGFQNFGYEIVGDHIEIKTDEDSHKMKEILSSYLGIR